MQMTGRSDGDRMIAAAVALVVNGLIAWQLQALLSPQPMTVDAASASLQVVWIAAVPRRAIVAAPAQDHAAKGHQSPVNDRPPEARVRPEVAPPELPADLTPTRPMTAVYLQQARQWAQQHPVATAPADPFANRPVPLTDQAASRFRLKRQVSVADAVAMVGELFGGAGYTTDDCRLIRGRIVGLVAGGDEQAAQQDLDFERRHCSP